jgi:hypothetical protein
MSELSSLDHEEVIRRISRDLVDGYDEELEMEIEDHHPLAEVGPHKWTRGRSNTGRSISVSCSICRLS